MSNQPLQISRATNLEELGIILSQCFPEESRQLGLAFKPQSSDIFISPYAKCGTTWLQQIVHGLRTRGSMDFDDITSVTPWIDIAHFMGWDLEAAQLAEPRVYKSHVSWHDIPKGGRYICSFRNPDDAFLSFYRFFENFFFEAGTISIDEFFYGLWGHPERKNRYWSHLASWWEQRNNQDVLLLSYEDMKADLVGTVKRIASFMNISLDDELLDLVVRQSSREFMLMHKDKFNELPFRKHASALGIFPFDVDAHKVTAGSSNNYQLSLAIKRDLDSLWKEHIQAKFGFKSYEEFQANLNAHRSPN